MKIFLIGIGGIAMGNLAYMLKSIGHDVSGSDENLYPPMSTKLDEWGLNPKIGYNAENVRSSDLVIIGNAISRGNPELEEVLNTGMEYMSMPQAIGHFFLKKKKVIVIAGTHGKTTTTFLLHHLLKETGFSPGLFVGGIRKDGLPGFEIGQGEYFVIEGDEYDSAFFDKSSKFLHYKPYYLILTSLDFDHADIFPDLESIKVMFRRVLNLVPSKGKVFF
ncbi:MAG: UDP-N-acetylmuramate--alanine ligase, partial [Leptospira sp.]|nr:UDP-N-acetylmuramate--alanine ligase [Leptospira sp.]